MARDIAQTDAYVVSWRDWRKVEMLFAHLKRNSTGCGCADQKESEKSCISPLQQNLRKLAKLLQNGPQTSRVKGEPPSANPPRHGWTQTADFFDGIGPIAGVWNIWFRALRIMVPKVLLLLLRSVKSIPLIKFRFSQPRHMRWVFTTPWPNQVCW